MLLSERFVKAVGLANDLHKGHLRKGTQIPYLSHLLAVASLVIESGGNEDETIAALLHDAVEDCGGAEAMKQIREHFGENVAAIVDGCTETDQKPKPPWKPRKDQYIEQIKTGSPSVRLVSCADKLHNVSSTLAEHRQVGEKIWEKFKVTKEETLWFYKAYLGALRDSEGNRPIFYELELAVYELEKVINGKVAQ